MPQRYIRTLSACYVLSLCPYQGGEEVAGPPGPGKDGVTFCGHLKGRACHLARKSDTKSLSRSLLSMSSATPTFLSVLLNSNSFFTSTFFFHFPFQRDCQRKENANRGSLDNRTVSSKSTPSFCVYPFARRRALNPSIDPSDFSFILDTQGLPTIFMEG